jgi:hypothetical protein
MRHNNRLHSDKIQLRSFLTALYLAGEARRSIERTCFLLNLQKFVDIRNFLYQYNIIHKKELEE